MRLNVVQQASALSRFVSKDLLKLRSSTTLIISSAPYDISGGSRGNDPKIKHSIETYHQKLNRQIQQAESILRLQYQIPSHSYGSQTLTSSYPTLQSLTSANEFQQRVGATHIVGVGSGVALDLSKALHQRIQQSAGDNKDDLKLTLIPGTLGACCASTTNQSLLLDVDEAALIIAEDGKISPKIRNVVVDANAMAIPAWVSGEPSSIATVMDAALASIVIALDSLLNVDLNNGKGEKWELITKTLHHSQLVLESFLKKSSSPSDKESYAFSPTKSDKANAIQAMLFSGQLLSNGVENEREYAYSTQRSIPLALSSALLPRYFPHGNWVSFTASLLPGILKSTKMENRNFQSETISSGIAAVTQLLDDKSLQKIVPTISSLVEGTPDSRELMKAVEDNGALWNCEDVDRSLLEHVLCTSLSY